MIVFMVCWCWVLCGIFYFCCRLCWSSNFIWNYGKLWLILSMLVIWFLDCFGCWVSSLVFVLWIWDLCVFGGLIWMWIMVWWMCFFVIILNWISWKNIGRIVWELLVFLKWVLLVLWNWFVFCCIKNGFCFWVKLLWNWVRLLRLFMFCVFWWINIIVDLFWFSLIEVKVVMFWLELFVMVIVENCDNFIGRVRRISWVFWVWLLILWYCGIFCILKLLLIICVIRGLWCVMRILYVCYLLFMIICMWWGGIGL